MPDESYSDKLKRVAGKVVDLTGVKGAPKAAGKVVEKAGDVVNRGVDEVVYRAAAASQPAKIPTANSGGPRTQAALIPSSKALSNFHQDQAFPVSRPKDGLDMEYPDNSVFRDTYEEPHVWQNPKLDRDPQPWIDGPPRVPHPPQGPNIDDGSEDVEDWSVHNSDNVEARLGRANKGRDESGPVTQAVERLRGKFQEPVDSVARAAYWAPGLHQTFNAAGLAPPPESPQVVSRDQQLAEQQRMIDALKYQQQQAAIQNLKKKLESGN